MSVRALRVLRDAEDAVAARVEALVARGLDASLAEGARRAARALDQEVARAIASGATPACRAGCAACCHVHVDVTAAEIGAILEHLREAWSDVDRVALVAKLTAQTARIERLDADARWAARVPCGLLADDGRCSIYEARPLRCRAFHSISADACARAEGEPPTIRTIDRACEAAERGFEQALERAGGSAKPALLEPALLAALREL